ncbi:chemotaxis protein CheW [Cryptosporangium japonicum]|uniref:Chemotaxis protein CheW n=1 Tax=Cryptosporangium japonicum TaxID=80872 RepID=A0ABN0UA57_9ACTN
MSSRQYTTFEVADQLFGVDVAKVVEVLRFSEYTRVPLADRSVGGLINLRGQVMAAVDLRVRLGLEPRDMSKPSMNVIVSEEGEAISLLVDKIGDVVELQSDTFEPPPDTLAGPLRELIIGAFKLDSRLMLALDAKRAVDLASSTAKAAAR